MLNVGLRVVKLGKSSLMYEVGVFQEGSEQVKVSHSPFGLVLVSQDPPYDRCYQFAAEKTYCTQEENHGNSANGFQAVGGFTQIWVERKTNRPTAEGVPAHVRKELEVLLKGSEQDPATKSKL